MTEADWLTGTDLQAMLHWLDGTAAARPPPQARRKLLLFVCACCRRLEGRLSGAGRRALETVERHADGLATPERVRAARRANRAERAGLWWAAEVAAQAAESLATSPFAAHPTGEAHYAAWAVNVSGSEAERAAQCALLRDLWGNPFRPLPVEPAWLAWRGGLAGTIAADVYEGRAFERLPILADALEDAGCAEAAILDHLRGPGLHSRGCHVLDWALGKN